MKQKTDSKKLIPIILCIGFVQLIVHYYSYHTNFSQFDWYQDTNDVAIDYFLVWKMIATVILGIVMLVVLAVTYLRNQKTFQFEKSFYFLLAYTVLVILSTIFSPYKYWVFHGTFELMEPVWGVFTYLILFYYTYCFVTEKQQVYQILQWSMIGMVILLFIGAFQSFGYDIFRTGVGRMLVLNPSQWGDEALLDTTTIGEDVAFSTLYNQNYVSQYAGMLVMLFAMMLVGVKALWKKAVVCICLILSLICLWGSRSVSGYFAVAAGVFVVFCVLMCRKKVTTVICLVLIGLGVVGAGVFGYKALVTNEIETNLLGTGHSRDEIPVKYIETRDDCVVLGIGENQLKLSYEITDEGYMGIDCEDEDGHRLELEQFEESYIENRTYVIKDSRYEGVYICPVFIDEQVGIRVNYWKEWIFAKDESGAYKMRNYVGKWVSINNGNESTYFRDDMMTGRGHIWNNIIPLLPKYILLGSGANTFAMVYPQDDILYKSFWSDVSTMDVKAHNWYLQQWVEEGLLALLCLICFFGCYLLQSFGIYRKISLNQPLAWIGLGIFSAVTAFLVGAVVNDLMAGISQIFWGILGLGFAVNHMLYQEWKVEHRLVEEIAENEEKKVIEVEATVNKEKRSTTRKKQSRKERKGKK